MSWLQENQGFLVIGVIAVLVVVAGFARRRRRDREDRAADGAAAGRTWQDGPDAAVQKTLASLATVVRFPIDVDAASSVLGGARLPRFWAHDDPLEWTIRFAPGEVVPSTLARLEADPDGSRLSLVRAAEIGGVPASEADWRKLRRMAVAAARAADVGATEEVGAAFVRVPTSEVAGMPSEQAALTPYLWVRETSA
ncbi:hypothetical protein [Agromyces sp. Marseille-Q5079]|uniref:hypothetical protein n=1 Tax=Agromyces sp. Marseille-Q5079 TaxID=3439059 RepID=UPI003D9CB108